MDDLSATLSQILSDPESIRQLQNMAASLGLGGNSSGAGQPVQPEGGNASRYSQQGQPHGDFRDRPHSPRTPDPPPPQQGGPPDFSSLFQGMGAAGMQNQQEPQGSGASGVDLSALSALVDRIAGNNQPSRPQQQSALPDMSSLLAGLGGGQGRNTVQNQGGGLDLSALAGMLGGASGGSSQPSPSGGGMDLSALSGLLGGLGGNQGSPQSGGGMDFSALSGLLGQPQQHNDSGNLNLGALTSMLGGPSQNQGGGPLGIDMGTLLKVQKAMAGISSANQNVQLLLSLKKHLKTEERAKKVDDAIRVMQLIQFLPLLKESGLFSGMEKLFDGFSLDRFGLGGIANGLNLFGGR